MAAVSSQLRPRPSLLILFCVLWLLHSWLCRLAVIFGKPIELGRPANNVCLIDFPHWVIGRFKLDGELDFEALFHSKGDFSEVLATLEEEFPLQGVDTHTDPLLPVVRARR